MTKASGPDISFYQDDNTTPQGIDFKKMRERADFVIVRVGQSNWLDPDFKTNWSEAKKSGLPRGSYWFYDSRTKPREQAELWRDALGEDQGELPLFADFEEKYGGAYTGWQHWYTFLEEIKKVMPEKEIFVYTNYYYWRSNAPNSATHPDSLAYFHQYPLWVARYDATEPLVPAPWKDNEWVFWQYTEHGDGIAYGVESHGIDLNYFNGTREDFFNRFNITPPGPVSYKVDISLRELPDRNAAVLGTLTHEETLEKVGGENSGKWIRVRRANGQEGWVYLEHLLLELDEPEKNWAQVIPSSGLNVRKGAGMDSEKVGQLDTGDLVKVLGFNDEEESWANILRESDGLKGWCDSNYLRFMEEKPSDEIDNEEEGEEESDDKWQLVTVPVLNFRTGPSTTYDVIGKLKGGEVVEKLDTNDDGKWYQVRNAKKVEGWAYATYLKKTGDPNDKPPAVNKEKLGRFQVNTHTLRIRETPDTSAETLGFAKEDDILWVSDLTEDEVWQKVTFGDLVGWCGANYLTRYPPREKVNEKYFNGAVRYIRDVREEPRKMLIHVFAIDMSKKLDFLVTPPDHNQDAAPICSRTTTRFLEEFGMHIAINGDGYQYANLPGLVCPEGSELLNPNSYAASRGNIYSQQWSTDRPIMYINQNNEVTYNKPKGAVLNAISGDQMLVEKGKPVEGLDNKRLEPRSAVGTNQNGKWMLMIVVDGRQPEYSEGCTLKELAEMMIEFGGIYDAINLDGGGSSALVIEKDGKPFLLNSPIEDGIGGKERKVANHLGLSVK